MPFDSHKFMATSFEPRTAELELPGLKDWFGEGEKPVWKVRGQTADEVARVIDASTTHKSVDNIIKALASNAEKIAELRTALGIGKDTPADVIKRCEMIVVCSIEPKVELDVVVKLGETRPIEFFHISNEITRLTGLGMDIKKLNPSGEMEKSEA